MSISPSIFAQEKSANDRTSPNYYLSLGLNVLDNGGSELPFDSKKLGFKNPFFIGIESHFPSDLAVSLSFSVNKAEIQAEEKEYYSIDLSGLYYFDDYIFKNKNIDTYAGLGLGRQYLWNNGSYTVNGILGGRYWILENFAVSLDGVAKIGIKSKNDYILNTYKYNLGIVWNIN